MLFKDLATYLEKLEKTTSRNAIIEILAELFGKTAASEIDKLMYLLQGRVAPTYKALEIGMADKMMVKALAFAHNTDETKVLRLMRTKGDIGLAAEELAHAKKIQAGRVSITDVFNTLKDVAETGGEGSVEKKISLLAHLFQKLDPLSSRFVARIPVGKMRLGFSDMTVLDSFSWMLSKSKAHREETERAYNVRPDLGFIGRTLKEHGLRGLSRVKPVVFTPILMARAERLSSADEIIKKIGKCAIEPKIDGFRLQGHYNRREVKLFTRNLEDATFMYPDIVEAIKKQIHAKEIIFEGEAIAYNPNTGEYLPFQETVQRKRKYGIEEKAKEVPLKMILFDLLYMNGRNLIPESYSKRRAELEKVLKSKQDTLILSDEKVFDNAHSIEIAFDEAVSRGLEGVMAKKLDGVYQAGARGWNWIKLKRSYSAGALNDTIDCLVMGYNFGQGKRTSFGLGAFLIGIYDTKNDQYKTIAKIGTGLTDEEWKALFKQCQKLKTEVKPPLYDVDKLLEPDVWVAPDIVVEIRADEITRSPIHTAGRKMRASKSGSAFDVDVPGYALRFPRLERFRDDRKPEDVTSLKEIEEMFKKQRKK